MSYTICDIVCPSCGVKCWFNNGDIEDLTVPDVEAVRCWKCSHEFKTDEFDDTSIEDLLVEDTFPNVKDTI